MPRRVRILKRIAACVKEAVVIYHTCGVGHHGVGGDEGTERGVVVAGIVVHQPRRVGLLPCEGAVGLEVAGRAVLGDVGVVGAAGGLGRAARSQGCAAEVVAVRPALSVGPDWTRGASGFGLR